MLFSLLHLQVLVMSMETLTPGIIAKLCTGIPNAECVVQIIALINDNGTYRVAIHDGIHMSTRQVFDECVYDTQRR